MRNSVLLIAILLISALVTNSLRMTFAKRLKKQKTKFYYERKEYLMTSHESNFFDVLEKVVGKDYYIFPQVHLSSILDHRVRGHGYQNWTQAFRHINQKSVDYVICDKVNKRPVAAIELDDRTHDDGTRIIRDSNVEEMLREAGMPLLRFRRPEEKTVDEVSTRLRSLLPNTFPEPFEANK